MTPTMQNTGSFRNLHAALVVCTIVGTALLTQRAAQGADMAEAAQSRTLQKTLDTCASCHGANGRSVSPTFPSLAAQTAPYIEAQLRAFKDQSRADPDAQAYMWGMAAQLDDASISGLAAYFSKQLPAKHAGGSPELVGRGREIFLGGIPDRGIPACASCHGPLGQGNGPFPRLAGQHAPYLLKQLLVIQSVLRTAPVMHGIIKGLDRDQMQAVATYLESI